METFIALHPGKVPNNYEIDALLPFFLTEEEGGVTAHSPHLDFSTCGKDRADAEKMFNEGVMIFLKELVKMGTLEEVLRECGWRKAPLPDNPERWVPPELVWPEQSLKAAVGAPA